MTFGKNSAAHILPIMRAVTLIAIGIVAGMAVTSAVLMIRYSNERSLVEVEVEMLKRKLQKAEEAVAQGREALRTARQANSGFPVRDATEARSSASVAPRIGPGEGPMNTQVATYLGDPVPPPVALDRKYSAEEMVSAFKSLCESRGIRIEKVGVDTSEFPFILHGVIQGDKDFMLKVGFELKSLPDYSYGGCDWGRSSNGGTFFSLNMTPSRVYPPEHSEAIRRRLTLRLQMTAAVWADAPP